MDGWMDGWMDGSLLKVIRPILALYTRKIPSLIPGSLTTFLVIEILKPRSIHCVLSVKKSMILYKTKRN